MKWRCLKIQMSIRIRKSDYLAAIHVAYFPRQKIEGRNATLYTVRCNSIFKKTLMSNVVTGVYNKTFSMTTLETTEQHLHSTVASSSSGRAAKVVTTDENPGKILRANSMYWTDLLLAWLSSIVWKFVPRSSHSSGTSLKRLKLSVSILGSSYSHLCRYFKSSKKMDIAIWIFALTSHPHSLWIRVCYRSALEKCISREFENFPFIVLLTAAILPRNIYKTESIKVS